MHATTITLAEWSPQHPIDIRRELLVAPGTASVLRRISVIRRSLFTEKLSQHNYPERDSS